MYYWLGCEIEIQGVKPAQCEPYYAYPTIQNLSDAIDHTVNAMQHNIADFAGMLHIR